jgi:hypothetical protein
LSPTTFVVGDNDDFRLGSKKFSSLLSIYSPKLKSSKNFS